MMKLCLLLSLLRRVAGRLSRDYSNLKEQVRGAFVPTFPPVSAESEPLARRFQFLDSSCCLARIRVHSPGHFDLVRHQAEDFLDHRFDMLGSGAVVVAHGLACAGLEGHSFAPEPAITPDPQGLWLQGRINHANLAEAQRIWSQVGPGYRPIDWQLDFKSGFRWSEQTWYRAIRFAHQPGVDVKVPWELARMQHLPVIALAARYARAGLANFRPAEEYGQEVLNQILDFIATNPPGFGVNWSCAMDVAIRIANMLVARDILLGAGFALDKEAEAIFATSVRSHARHIAANLEWAPRFRANHYLADIVGLLFCAVYLPRDEESNLWLHFATLELLSEIEYQFHPDGSNFEASVCYHRLSSEIVLWGLALLDNLTPEQCAALQSPRGWPGRRPPRRPLHSVLLHVIPGSEQTGPVPPWCRERVAAMAAFTRTMTRPDGLVTQFGDNDSGRFLVLAGIEQLRAGGRPDNPAWSLDHGGFLAAAAAFLGHPPTEIDAEILAGLAHRQPSIQTFALPLPAITVGNEGVWQELQALAQDCPEISRWCSEFTTKPGLLDGFEMRCFPDMGCYVLRSPRLYLAIRCGEIGLAGLGAHAHCDQLSIELVIDGESCMRDPGSYIYTALPARRNDYRSASAHHVPRCGTQEPANLTLGNFDLRGAAEGECLYFGPRGFIGRHAGYGGWIYRSVALDNDRIVILDFSPCGLFVTDPTPKPLAFSQAYGRLTART